jgi:N-acetylglutamate synthase-like GNAT family acetyltransferase
MEYTIRQARSEDSETLVKLIRTGFRDVAERFGLTRENCPTHPSNCTLESVKADLSKGVKYFVLEQDGSPVGCVAVEQANPQTCYVERLAVLAESRHKGFGQALMKHAMGVAKELGAVRAEIGIISGNVELKDWYERMGFVVTQTRNFPHLPFQVTFMAIDL